MNKDNNVNYKWCEHCNICPVTKIKKVIKIYKRWADNRKILKELRKKRRNGIPIIIPPMPDTFEEALRQFESGDMTEFK